MSGNRKAYVDYTIPVIPGDNACVALKPSDYKTVRQRTVNGVLTHHGKWWSYPMAASFDAMFMDALGDRRNGDGTLRPYVSPADVHRYR